MKFREPSAEKVRDILLSSRPRRGSKNAALTPDEGDVAAGYLFGEYGYHAHELTDEQKKDIARRLHSGGVSVGVVAIILDMEGRRNTIDRWVRDHHPTKVVTLDGKIRSLKPPKTEPLELTAEAPTPRAVLDALIALRRARVPVKDRPDYLRRFRGLPESATVFQRREAARALTAKGFTPSVISPIVGIPRATVYRWIADVETELRYGIRGTELGDGTGQEAENIF